MNYFQRKKELKAIKMLSSFDCPSIAIQRTFEREHDKRHRKTKIVESEVVGAQYHGDNIAMVERQLAEVKR